MAVTNLFRIRLLTVITTFLTGVIPLGLLVNPDYQRPADVGREIRDSLPIYITYFCIASSTIPILLDILFDMASGLVSEESVTFLPVKKFVFDRFCILMGILIPAVGHIIILLSPTSNMIVGYFNLNTVTAEVFWFLGIVFAIFERIGHNPEINFKIYCTITSLAMCINVCTTLNYSIFGNTNLVLAVCSWLFGTCIVGLMIYMYIKAWMAYSGALEKDPQFTTLEGFEAFAVLVYMTFGIMLTISTLGMVVANTFSPYTYNRVAFNMTKLLLVVIVSVVSGRTERFQIMSMEQSLVERTRFIRYISHEVRSPLNVICGGIVLLESLCSEIKESARGTASDIIASIKDAAGTATVVLNDVLLMDKIVSKSMIVELAPIDIKLCIEKCLGSTGFEMLNKGLTFNVPDSSVYEELSRYRLQVDLPKLVACFRNITSNAAKFTPPKGSISVDLHAISKQHLAHLRSHNSDDIYNRGCPRAFTGLWTAAGHRSVIPLRPLHASNTMEFAALPPIEDDGFNGQTGHSRSYLPSSHYLKIQVTDSGCGISPEDIPKLFHVAGFQINPSLQQDGEGTGFGLVITKGILDLHGGFVEVQSEGLGKGSIFSIILPLFRSNSVNPDNSCDADEAMSRNSSMPGDVPSSNENVPSSECSPYSNSSWILQGKHMLLVDDVAGCNKVLMHLLSKRGVVCETASNGLIAKEMVQNRIEKLEKHKALMDMRQGGGENEEIFPLYDVILMDNIMPVMDGLQATREIREMAFTNLIVGLTGCLLESDIAQFMSAGTDFVLPKPFELDEFVAKIRSVSYLPPV